MTPIICIVARMASKRLPGKAMADIHGKPLLERLVESMLTVSLPVVVCTDRNSPEIVALAEEYMLDVVKGDTLDVASRLFEAAHIHKADTLVRVTGDNPLTSTHMLELLLTAHRLTQAEYTCAPGLPRGTKPEVIDTVALWMLYEAMTAEERQHTEYLTDYLMRLRACAITTPLDCDKSFTVDTAEDLERVRRVYAENEAPTIYDLVRL